MDAYDWVHRDMMPSILGVIGRTPLIPLRWIAQGVAARILVKLESLNPGGSIKDRVGMAMVDIITRIDPIEYWNRPRQG
jgi:cysteine synthase